MSFPPSVIWFAIFSILFVIYGLHYSHIKAIGFDAYVAELMRKYDLEYKESRSKAIISFYSSLVIFVASGICATACAGISIINLLNGQ